MKKLTNDQLISQERELVDQLDYQLEMPCEGALHEFGYGHAPGPAAFSVTIACPSGDYSEFVLLCAGRVESVAKACVEMSCPTCEERYPWQEFWIRIVALDIPAVTS